MNQEEIKKQFELAALGCLDNHQYNEFIKAISEDEQLKKEFGQYQKVAALIPFSINIQQPNPDTKNKVVLEIKKIILSKLKETKTDSLKPMEDKTEGSKVKPLDETKEELLHDNIDKNVDSQIESSREIISQNVDNSLTQIDEQEKVLTNNSTQILDQTDSNDEPLRDPNVKVNIDYSPAFKDEIVEEVTKRLRKTVQYQFEDFENKINKKSKSIKFFLILITLITLILTALNIYQIFFFEKKVEIKKEIKTPVIDTPDSLK